MTAVTGIGPILATAHSALSDAGAFGLNRGLPMPRHEFFAKIGRALMEPFVDRGLTVMLGLITPGLVAAGFVIAEAPVFKRTMASNFAIREARVLLADPSATNAAPPLAVMVRLYARCDRHYDMNASDLVLDVVARRSEAIEGDPKALRPFLRVDLAGVRVDWSNLIGQSFTEALADAMTFARGMGETEGTFAAGARDFTSKLVDTLAP